LTIQSIPFFCGRDCGGNACPLLAWVEDGRVTRISNNPAGGKYLKGCQRGFNLPLTQSAPDRILKPLVRSGPRGSGQFREAGWDEALDITAGNLGEIRAKYGPHAVMNLGSAGVTGALHATYPLVSRFLALFGGCTNLSSNYSNGAARFVLPYVLGQDWTRAGFDPATLQHAQMIVLWGANVLDTRLGSELPQRLVEARRQGKQIVVIDPRRSATVKQAATWWIPCRPGTDAALMLAVLYVLVSEERVDRAFIEAHSVGFQDLEKYVLGLDGSPGSCARTPDWAAGICGVPAEEITRFASAYGGSKPAMLIPGYSIQRVFAGEETYRLTVALQIATGNFGQRGGSTGALNNRLAAPRVGTLPVPVLDALPELPIQRWPDAILEGRGGGYPTDVRAAYVLGSNFINQGSDIRKNMAAFEKLDFAICHDVFLTPTARWCDVVFPAATALEKEDIGIPWLGNYLAYKPQILPASGQARSDYDALCDLADRLGFRAEFSEGRAASDWIVEFIRHSEIPDPEEFRRTGIYWGAEQERVGLADFSADPRGYPLSTPSGKVEIASQAYHQDTGFPAIPTWQPPPADPRFPLRLITPKSPHLVHSQGSNIPQIRDKPAHALSMHPQDAAARAVRDGDLVLLFNERGAARILARISDDLIPGVVCLPEGGWAALDENGVDTGGSANMLTSSDGTRPGLACIMHAVGVEVKPIHSPPN